MDRWIEDLSIDGAREKSIKKIDRNKETICIHMDTTVSIFLKLVYPLVNRIRARWIWNRGKRYLVYGKLDPVKIAWIIREKEKRLLTTVAIAERMGVSSVWVKKLWRRYRVDNNSEKLPDLRKPGRKALAPSEDEKKIIQEAYEKYEVNALTLERVID
ncbi:MAG: hypothetical protein ACYC7D_12405 [Nitrososphaerales archaeon]